MGLTNKNCEESEIDLMPDGWKTERLGQLVRKFVNGGTPTGKSGLIDQDRPIFVDHHIILIN